MSAGGARCGDKRLPRCYRCLVQIPPGPDRVIVLTTLNARFIHSSFGLRYLHANMGVLGDCTEILEFTISERPHELAERLLAKKPRIIGFGVYIWNISQTTELISILRRVAPDIVIIAGGPEVSYETADSPLYSLVDFLVTGEADLEFPRLCQAILDGNAPEARVIHASTPDVTQLELPYDRYSETDIANRIIYVEASRGCPFTCEFCLSSLNIPVRQFPLEPFLASMDRLFTRGVRHFKFVDRTFNLNLKISRAILEFFLERYEPGLFVHFEMVPDRLPEGLRQIIAQFPRGALQFEIGIQTFNPEVSALISRRQDYEKIAENIRWLRAASGVHLHADLIAGLPGETLESFATGFNTLVGLGPQEIQVGILKRLRGTPIIRHDTEWQMVYASHPPYELLKNRLLSFEDMQRLGRFSRFWDMLANSGNFRDSLELIWQGTPGPFEGFMAWCDWLYARTQERHGFSVKRLSEMLYAYLTEVREFPDELVIPRLRSDYMRNGARDLPTVLKTALRPTLQGAGISGDSAAGLPARQQRHL